MAGKKKSTPIPLQSLDLVYSKKIMNSRFEAGLRKNKFVSLLFFVR